MRDLLTEEEVSALIYAHTNVSTSGERAALQAAARLGAERERERAARVCEGLGTQYGEHPEWAQTCAEAIRRGEGEQA